MRSPRADVAQHIGRLRGLLETALAGAEAEQAEIASGAASGRACAARICAAADLPGTDNSQMDGFALRAEDVRPGGELPLSGVVAAGAMPQSLQPGTVMAIMTGAPVPSGADCIVPVERTSVGSFDAVDLAAAVGQNIGISADAQISPGTFIRPRGSDVSRGDPVAEPGARLSPAHLGLLAACGVTSVPVLRQPSALVLATGDEVRPAPAPSSGGRAGEASSAGLAAGHVYDANTPLITATVQAFGCRVLAQHVSTDDPEAFLAVLDEAIAEHAPDIVITAGGISMGAYEVVRQGLAQRGVAFGSVAQQPGGPQGWGRESHSGSAVISLPGNPVSCAVSLETLVRPALAAVHPGCPPQRRLRVRLADAVDSPAGVRQFRRVALERPEISPAHRAEPEEGLPLARTVGGPGSHLLGHLARADALLELTEDDVAAPAGSIRDAILLTGKDSP